MTDTIQIQLKTSEDFKLVLKKGNGPVYVMGTQSTMFFNDMDDASMDDEEDMNEESEASPVKLVKVAGTKKKIIETDEEDTEGEGPQKAEKSPPARKKEIEEPKVCNIRLLQSHMRLKKNRPYNYWLRSQGHYLLCFSASNQSEPIRFACDMRLRPVTA